MRASPSSSWYAPGLRFTCTACGRCCRNQGGRDTVYVNWQELERIARFLGLTRAQVRERYTRLTEERERMLDSYGEDCVFLRQGRCEVYPVRPIQCRTWPFWPENIVDTVAWQVSTAACPGADLGSLHTVTTIRQVADALQRADAGECVSPARIPDLAPTTAPVPRVEESPWGE